MKTDKKIEEILIKYENKDIFSKLTPYGRQQRLEELTDLLNTEVQKAVEDGEMGYLEKAEFVKRIPAGYTFVYENKTGEELYLIARQSLDKGDKDENR